MIAEALVTLLFTLPSQVQDRWKIWDSELGDSVTVGDCSGGQAIHQLATARLWFIPVTGGGWRVVQQKDVSNRQGQPDSFVVDGGPGGHYYVSTLNPVGESCASPEVYVPGSVVTGVEPDGPPRNPATIVRTFDLQGRLLRAPPTRSGIYFRRTVFRDGQVVTKKFVVLN